MYYLLSLGKEGHLTLTPPLHSHSSNVQLFSPPPPAHPRDHLNSKKSQGCMPADIWYIFPIQKYQRTGKTAYG